MKTTRRSDYYLTHASLSGSGLAVQGAHILDPRTGRPASRQNRAWVLADTAAESDALSTACMVLSEPELEEVLAQNHSWLAFLETDEGYRPLGRRVLPIRSVEFRCEKCSGGRAANLRIESIDMVMLTS